MNQFKENIRKMGIGNNKSTSILEGAKFDLIKDIRDREPNKKALENAKFPRPEKNIGREPGE